MDMPEAEENLEKFKEQLKEDYPIFPISAVSRKGLRELLFAIADKLEETPEFPLQHEEEETGVHHVLYKHEAETRSVYDYKRT